jgi:UDP-3-O-[3-hydroxymyristoyl] glucosamine N-acyltransferase
MKFNHPRTLADLAEMTGAVLSDPKAGELELSGVNTVEAAEAGDIVWAESKEALAVLVDSPAAAAIVPMQAGPLPIPGLRHPLPKLVFGKILEEFLPDGEGDLQTTVIHPNAWVDPRAIICGEVIIGAGSRISAGAVIGRGCRIGEHCQVGYNAVLNWGTVLADRVIVHSGAVLGTDGFGYVQMPAEDAPGFFKSIKIPHVGVVTIESDVEIGANVCIDRGLLQPTVIGRGTKIDNLVQIGHNCQIGPHNIIISQVGYSGSITTGTNVIAAGQAGVSDHVHIGDGAILMAGVKIGADIAPKAKIIGYPPLSRQDFFRFMSTQMDVPLIRKIVKAAKESSDYTEFQVKIRALKDSSEK